MGADGDIFEYDYHKSPDGAGKSRFDANSKGNILQSLLLQFFVLITYLVIVECLFTVFVNAFFHDNFSKWTEGFINAIIVALVLTPIIWQLIIKRDRTLLKQHQEALKKEIRIQQLNGNMNISSTHPIPFRVYIVFILVVGF